MNDPEWKCIVEGCDSDELDSIELLLTEPLPKPTIARGFVRHQGYICFDHKREITNGTSRSISIGYSCGTPSSEAKHKAEKGERND